MTQRAADVPAWYGKLAALGDFAQRRAPPHWLERCDPWLSASMEAGQHALGTRWLRAYMTAPVLRYAWAPGVIDAQWWFGLLMPSCDKVGRYFPLLVGQPRERAPVDRIALDHLELWYEHLSQAALQTLDGAAGSLQAFEDELLEAPPWPTPGHAAAHGVAGAGPGVERWCGGGAMPLSQWMHAPASAGLLKRLEGHSLWWRAGANGADASIDIVPGLPTALQFVALIEGAR
jgi:type VI secretion system protein ImpM